MHTVAHFHLNLNGVFERFPENDVGMFVKFGRLSRVRKRTEDFDVDEAVGGLRHLHLHQKVGASHNLAVRERGEEEEKEDLNEKESRSQRFISFLPFQIRCSTHLL